METLDNNEYDKIGRLIQTTHSHVNDLDLGSDEEEEEEDVFSTSSEQLKCTRHGRKNGIPTQSFHPEVEKESFLT
jgi:hypothetical protein